MEEEELDFGPCDLDEWRGQDVTGAIQEEESDALDAMEPARRSMTIFFLIDTSSSMAGTKIGTVNGTMEELIPELIDVGGDADIRVAVLRYSTDVEWITEDGPVLAREYESWKRLSADGMTSLGAAFQELNRKLSRSAFMNRPSVSYAPVIFLMTDGEPNDDWQSGLHALEYNSWFRYGLKIAVGIGSAPDMEILRAFTGRPELAVQAHGPKELKAMIQLLAVTSSQIGSKSMMLTDDGVELTEEDAAGSKEARLIGAVKDIMGDTARMADMDYEFGW